MSVRRLALPGNLSRVALGDGMGNLIRRSLCLFFDHQAPSRPRPPVLGARAAELPRHSYYLRRPSHLLERALLLRGPLPFPFIPASSQAATISLVLSFFLTWFPSKH